MRKNRIRLTEKIIKTYIIYYYNINRHVVKYFVRAFLTLLPLFIHEKSSDTLGAFQQLKKGDEKHEIIYEKEVTLIYNRIINQKIRFVNPFWRKLHFLRSKLQKSRVKYKSLPAKQADLIN